MSEITTRQRRNADRELTSVVCVGCDGPKARGAAFCKPCYMLLLENRIIPILAPLFFAEKYYKGLTFLLSRKGQKLRSAA